MNGLAAPPVDRKGLGDRGVALVLVVFMLALATVLVFDLARRGEYDRRASRAFAEGVQDEYLLKSAVNVGRLLLEAPKPPGVNETWLGEPWALVAGAQDFPVDELRGRIRLMVVDESSKIDLNSVANRVPGQADTPANAFWRDALKKLFEQLGFEHEQFTESEGGTPGGVAFKFDDQVAVLHDWIDGDANSFSVDGFTGQGVEAQLGKKFFANRALHDLAELPLVPGFTLERVQRTAPFVRIVPVRAGTLTSLINVNTAPIEVLTALGFPDKVATDIFTERLKNPITQDNLRQIIQLANDPRLNQFTAVRSDQFSVIARVESANRSRWASALVTVTGSSIARRTTVNSLHIY